MTDMDSLREIGRLRAALLNVRRLAENALESPNGKGLTLGRVIRVVTETLGDRTE